MKVMTALFNTAVVLGVLTGASLGVTAAASDEPGATPELRIRGNSQLKNVVVKNLDAVEAQLNEGHAADATVDPSSLSCLGVLAEDVGDVSYPVDGVIGTCLARAELGWPDSDDTIVQISVTAPGPRYEFSAEILAEQL